MALDSIMNMGDQFSQNEALSPLMDVLTQIMEIDDKNLNGQAVDAISGAINGAFTDSIKKSAVDTMIKQFEESGTTKREVLANANTFKNEIMDLVNETLQPSAYKKKLLEAVFEPLYEIMDMAVERYHSYDIELPIMLEEGAQMPTYAHETDACADLYAAEDITVPAHTMSATLRTGVHIALPENWLALIFPRSSIGSKTPLRLSNSVGVIDEEYRGPLGVLYDNVSDSDVTFKQGDRIAQMLVMPSYKFKGIQVDALSETERGENGFGSSGK